MLLDSLRQVAARVQEVRKPGKHYFLSLKLNQVRWGATLAWNVV